MNDLSHIREQDVEATQTTTVGELEAGQIPENNSSNKPAKDHGGIKPSNGPIDDFPKLIDQLSEDHQAQRLLDAIDIPQLIAKLLHVVTLCVTELSSHDEVGVHHLVQSTLDLLLPCLMLPADLTVFTRFPALEKLVGQGLIKMKG